MTAHDEAALADLLLRVAEFSLDSGHSDLNDEQPVYVTLQLSDIYLAQRLTGFHGNNYKPESD